MLEEVDAKHILGFYLLIALVVFGVGLRAFLKDTTTPKTDFTSWVALVAAPLFWPVVVPLSLWELATKNRKK